MIGGDEQKGLTSLPPRGIKQLADCTHAFVRLFERFQISLSITTMSEFIGLSETEEKKMRFVGPKVGQREARSLCIVAEALREVRSGLPLFKCRMGLRDGSQQVEPSPRCLTHRHNPHIAGRECKRGSLARS